MENPNELKLEDLVCAIKRTDKGLAILIQPKSRSELIQAFGELQIALINETLRIQSESVKLHKPGILDLAKQRFNNGR